MPPPPRVRPKSTQRKQRSEVARRVHLPPTQRRSRKKYEDIIKATERLLEEAHIEDLSLLDIAAAADVPHPTAYYYFPTVAALQLELSRRHDDELHRVLIRHGELVEPDEISDWQDYLRSCSLVARNFFNLHRPACEARYGLSLHRNNRLENLDRKSQAGAAMILGLQRNFNLVYRPELQVVFTAKCEILDLFWSASYLRTGRIDDQALEDSLRASLGYLASFLPQLISFGARQKPNEDRILGLSAEEQMLE